MELSFSRRTPTAWLLATLCLLATTSAQAADEPTGKWKLVILAFGADDLAVVDVQNDDGKPKGVLLDWQKKMIGDVALENLKVEGNAVSFGLKGPAVAIQFAGEPAAENPKEGTLLGTVKFMNEIFPARLEKTQDDKVGEPQPNPIMQDVLKTVREHGPKSRVKKLQELITRNAGAPSSQALYTQLLVAAPEAGVPAAEVDNHVETWLNDAKPYGKTWTDEVRLKAVKALTQSKNYAETTLKLAQEADKAVPPDAALGSRVVIVGLLATAAKNAGKADLAKDAEARLAKLEGELDAEYHEKVPPFKTTAFTGRKKAGADRVVVLELFTGAQCPPCIAVDVAFDALLKTYKSTEFIGLQYHLHIPGPDPLTNTDSIARQNYYGEEIQGTPSTFFNGRADGAGGGPMGASEEKYKELRGLVDELLEKKARVDVKVSAKLEGDKIAITAEAAKTADADSPKTGERTSNRLSLRLALTEESIRYVGGNRLRFHNHVVRAFPGGPEGKKLVDGKGRVEIKVSLPELKRDLEGYLSQAAKERPFPFPLPEIAFKNLSVVAFVQDDADKSILGAATIPVAEATP
ncbi:MAG: hypothetical protein P4L85_04740 [Paludisphaera borealis]|uniref:hypothetical protein n=1 Tax=Paludisphaera borealis TaxID=1387353 RepID=UPI0028461E9E|nr:hypothetical protein [Paludisphaera borealis]MDR3618637.1 hypothetical protein [Paludisphaera borealis]